MTNYLPENRFLCPPFLEQAYFSTVYTWTLQFLVYKSRIVSRVILQSAFVRNEVLS